MSERRSPVEGAAGGGGYGLPFPRGERCYSERGYYEQVMSALQRV